MIAEIAALVGRYEPNTPAHRSLSTALHLAYAGDWMLCESALRYARSTAPLHLRMTADEQITPIIESVESIRATRRRVEKAYE